MIEITYTATDFKLQNCLIYIFYTYWNFMELKFFVFRNKKKQIGSYSIIHNKYTRALLYFPQ